MTTLQQKIVNRLAIIVEKLKDKNLTIDEEDDLYVEKLDLEEYLEDLGYTNN